MAGPKNCLRLLWFALGVLSFSFAQNVEGSAIESQALLDLKHENQPNALSSWKQGSDCCGGWAGVTCDTNGAHVIELNLTGRMQLYSAVFPRSFCNLHRLRVLNVSITLSVASEGQLPACLWNMTDMRYLTISTDHEPQDGLYFAATLPAQLCNLTNLTHLDLIGTSFQNSVPDCLWEMAKLEHLALESGLLTKSISSQICKLKNLTYLALEDRWSTMALDAYIPACIWKMSRLEYLHLGSFMQPSSISSDVCKLANLLVLELFDDNMYGDIPTCIWNLTRLERLTLLGGPDGLHLAGSFSTDICNLKNLSYLSVAFSVVHGYIPNCLWNMTGLGVFGVYSSVYDESEPLHIPGSFSSQMCKLSKLRTLAIPFKGFTGVLPACIWNLTQLEALDLSGMDLSSMEIPTEVFAPSLTNLNLGSTNINKAFLDAIGNLSSLQSLAIHGNNLTTLSPGIENLSQLQSLSASDNLFTTAPAWIAKLQNLMELDLASNNIRSLHLSNLSQLNYLDFSSNLLREVSLSDISMYQPEGTLDFSSNLLREVFLSNISMYQGYLYLRDNLINDNGTLLLNQCGLLYLGLSGNRIGSFPPSMLHVSWLEDLDLSDNFLEVVPASLSRLANLTRLILSNNPLRNMSGLCHLEDLAELYLSNISINTLDVKLALACLKNFSQLQRLDLTSNNITEDISALIFSITHNLTRLPSLDFSNNNISGDLSMFSGVFSVPDSLDVSRNQISRELPKSLLSRTGPDQVLNVSRNRLSGHIPEFYGRAEWRILDLSWNHFEGPLPRFSTSTFQSLVLSGNNFTGPIPSGLKKSINIEILDMSSNKLSGEIPAYLGDFKFLQVLDLTSNRFTGSLPETLADCVKLQHLRVGNNFLHGEIPSSIGNVGDSLVAVTMSHNALEGSIPSTLGNCVNLALLDLSHNNLTGTLPSTLDKLSASLLVFSVASNRLAGPFPAWIVSSNFSSLQVLDLSNNNFHGDLPADYYKLSGFINGTNAIEINTVYEDMYSVEISAKGQKLTITSFVTVRTSFDVSENFFSGYIPKQLGDLRALMDLTLSGNAFVGEIPTELSNLHELESLDLSKNSLKGSIPSELNGIPRLEYFNVSSNFLTGIIPTGGQFNTFNESSFRNNTGLCGGPVPPCHNPPADSPTKGTELTHDHYWRQKFPDWMSSDAFFLGFGSSCGVVSLTFLLSKTARSLLYVPRRKARRIYQYRKPYGAYMPKS